jgi:hypothetical protein
MSKTLPAPRTRAPTAANGISAPAAVNDVSEQGRTVKLPERRCIGAPRQAVPRRRICSNLAEPAGIFVWERDFLLGVAAEVLNELVDEKEDDEGEG